jgi:AcrR family transcriptional regulator
MKAKHIVESMPHSSERESVSSRERIFAAALETLENEGEAALRFVDIADRADVAISAITHYFRTRENLIAELHAHRFTGLVAADLAAIAQVTATARDRDAYTAGLAAVTAQIVATTRDPLRLARIVSIGATHGRPGLTERIRAEATHLLDGLTELIHAGQANGFVDPALDARALATFIHAYALGLVVADLDDTPVDRAAIAAIIGRAVTTFEAPAEG